MAIEIFWIYLIGFLIFWIMNLERTFVCGIVLFVSGIFLPLWEFLFSATSSYVAFDAIMSLILHQGEGYIKIGLDNEFQSKGHGFFAFFFGIVFGTAESIIALIYLLV